MKRGILNVKKEKSIWEKIQDSEEVYNPAHISRFEESNTFPLNYDDAESSPIEASHEQNDSTGFTAVVLTALREPEYTSLQRVFKEHVIETPLILDEFPVQHIEFRNKNDVAIRIIIASQQEMGMTASAIHVAELAKYNPKYFIMTGICAGIKEKANIGDLVVPQYLFDYNSGKKTSTIFHPDLRQVSVNDRIIANIRALLSDDDAWEKLTSGLSQAVEIEHRFKIRTDKMATGAGVIASEQIADLIGSQDRKACAVDMEAYAFVRAVQKLAGYSEPIVMKAVCDYADDSKDDRWQLYSSDLSARACKIFLDNIPD